VSDNSSVKTTKVSPKEFSIEFRESTKEAMAHPMPNFISDSFGKIRRENE